MDHAPVATPPDERIDPSLVTTALNTWRRGLAELDQTRIPPVFDKERAALTEAACLVQRGRCRSAFDLVAGQLADAPGARALPCGLARVLVRAHPRRYADAALELLNWVLVHRVEGVAEMLDPLLLRAEACYALGQLHNAVIDLKDVLHVLPAPGDWPGPAALLRLGDCLSRLGDTAGAAQAWERLLVARPLHAHAPLRLGYLALAQDKPGVAHRHLRRAGHCLKARPTPGEVRPMEHAVALGQYAVHRARGDGAAADRYLAAAASHVPEDPVTAAEQAIIAAAPGEKQALVQRAVDRAVRAANGVPVLDLLHELGLLDDERHRQACADHDGEC